MKITTIIVCLFPSAIFYLSMENPTSHLFLANWLPSDYSTILQNSQLLRMMLSVMEAEIAMFAWVSNVQVVFFLFNFSLLFKFWCDELNAKCPKNQISQSSSQLRRLEETMKVYRQLQLLMAPFNYTFSNQIKNLIVSAFVNQICINYGTIKLRNELSLIP